VSPSASTRGEFPIAVSQCVDRSQYCIHYSVLMLSSRCLVIASVVMLAMHTSARARYNYSVL